MANTRRLTAAAATLLSLGCLFTAPNLARGQAPSWLGASVIYCVDPEIFNHGTGSDKLQKVTSDLSRIKSMGCNVLWLMPVYPRGQNITINGVVFNNSINSPYCINDYEAVDSVNAGTSADLTSLVTTAHNLGMKVILDMVINQTSWDNPMVQADPALYKQGDTGHSNFDTIDFGWEYDLDVAQLDLTKTDTQTYVESVCKWWLTNYNVDGFRFDSADNNYPGQSYRSLPQSVADTIQTQLQAINPNVLMLGEEENVALADSPYQLDYGWNMWNLGVSYAFNNANQAVQMQYAWQLPYNGTAEPSGMMQMNVQDDWDYPGTDVVTLGGDPQAMAAAVWDFTITGVPLLYNGMEVANNYNGGLSHTGINWGGTDSAKFTTFYDQLLALRNNSGAALQQGSTSFVATSSSAVIAYDRQGGGNEYLIEINTNGGTPSGTISAPSGGAWTEVTPAGAPGGTSHTLPSTGNFSLAAYDFAMFYRPTAVPAGPTGLTATTETGQAVLLWTASTGAASYNVYRGTSPGTESQIGSCGGTEYNDLTVTPGVTYYYTVAGVNSYGTGSASNEAATVAPAAPTGLSAAGQSGVTALAWTPSTETASYNVYRGTSTGGESGTPIATGLTSPNYIDGTVSAANTYYYTVAAVNPNGTSGYSNEASVLAIPLPPTGFVATGATGQVILTWTTSTGASSYKLFRGTTPGGENATQIGTCGGGEYNDTTTSPGVTYYYTVAAVNGTGTSPYSHEASAFTTAATPTGLTATGQSGQIALSWTASTGASSYNVYRGTSPSGESGTPIATGLSSPGYTDTGLSAATTYYYTVASVNSTGTSVTSAEASATPIPLAPTGLSATSGVGQVVLNWTTSTGATSYKVFRGTTANGESGTPIGTCGGGNYIDNTAAAGTTYYYKVAAVNATGTSPNSNESSAMPIPAAPTGLTATGATGQVTLTWTTSAGASSYKVFRGTTANGESGTPIGTCGGGAYNDTTATPGTTYYYKVAAVDTGGTSPNSNEASAISGTTTVTVNPTADSYCQKSTATTNYGTNASILVKFQTSLGTNTRWGYLTFSLSGVSGLVESASMQLYGSSGNTNPDSIQAYQSTSTWGETTINWNNEPALSTTIGSTTTVGTTAQYYTWNITSWANTEISNGAVSVGLEMTNNPNSSAADTFNSKESSTNKPQLIIVYLPAPSAPSGLAANATTGQVALTWTAASNAATYNVYRGTSANGESGTPIATGVTSASYTDTGVVHGTKYYYKVAAVNPGGTSSKSNEASGTP